jgi:hypothetical protein
VGKDQHRWQKSIDDRALGVLKRAKERLEWAWKTDIRTPSSYPSNTGYAFHEIKGDLRARISEGEQIQRQLVEIPPPPPPPKRLSELVREQTIRAVYEQQNEGNYQEALRQAACGNPKGDLIWRKIWRAIDAAYAIDRYGEELAPKPRVQFLHRNMLEIADLAGLGDLHHEGTVEFLNDTCPCGRKHKSDAVRKLRRRWARTCRTKSRP